MALPINPTQLNPILSQNSIESFTAGLIFDELVSLDASGRDVPDLAAVVPTLENGGISKDGLTITYHLRHGVRWHDGAPFDSGDVKFTWQAIMNPRNNVVSRRGYDQVASVETPDPFTVVFHMKRFFAPAVDTIFGESDTPYRILPRHLLARYPDLNQVAFNSAPVGTGPYRFVRWLRGDRIVLAANPAYFRGVPKIATLVLKIIPDDNTTEAQIRTGEVGLALEITSNVYHRLQGSGATTLLSPAPSYTAFLYNLQRPPLNDVRVRHALTLAMDRGTITRNITFGTGALASADLSPFYWAFDKTLAPVPYDPAQAKALLDAAGWHPGPDGVRVKNGARLSLLLVYGQGSELARNATLAVQQDLRPVGVEVELKSFSYASLYAAAQSGGILNGGKFDIAVYSWISGADPDDSSQWMCAMIPPAGNNVSRYCSPEMDAAQRQALSTFDRTARKAAYARIESLLVRDAPGAFFYYRPLAYAYAPRLHHFQPNGISEGWNAQDWTLSGGQ